MAIIITEECINCGACEPECPNTAIYESGVGWKFSEGTALTSVEERNGIKIDPNKENNPKAEEFFYIVTDKCTECNGFHDEPQCAAVCPVDCCIIDEDNIESEEEKTDYEIRISDLSFQIDNALQDWQNGAKRDAIQP